MNTCIKDLNDKYEAVLKHSQNHNVALPNDGPFPKADLSFTEEVMEFPLSKKFKVLSIDLYNKSKRPGRPHWNLQNPHAVAGRPRSNLV